MSLLEKDNAESLMFTAKANYYRALEEEVRLRIKQFVKLGVKE